MLLIYYQPLPTFVKKKTGPQLQKKMLDVPNAWRKYLFA